MLASFKNRIQDNYYYNTQLEFLTKFNIINNLSQIKLKTIVLNFSFKDILFNEKKVIPFFLALELITGQKASVSVAKKPVIVLKVNKGTLTGCKVTLHRKKLYQFLDYLLLALPKSENFKGIFLSKIKNSNKNTFVMNLRNLFIFYQLEAEVDSSVQILQMIFTFNSKNNEEKAFLLSSLKFPILLN